MRHGHISLTKDKLVGLEQFNLEQSLQLDYEGKTKDFLNIDDNAKKYLRTSLGIDLIPET